MPLISYGYTSGSHYTEEIVPLTRTPEPLKVNDDLTLEWSDPTPSWTNGISHAEMMIGSANVGVFRTENTWSILVAPTDGTHQAEMLSRLPRLCYDSDEVTSQLVDALNQIIDALRNEDD